MRQKTPGPEESFGIRAREILNRGPEALTRPPALEKFNLMPPPERHAELDRLRVELYALSSIIADGAVNRSLASRDQYPPLGLLRSLFSDFGVLSANPSPIPESSITDFRQLGKALIDTMVFHLDAHLKHLRKSEEAWLVDGLARSLALFRSGADRQGQARMRDSFSYMYGGLQFGTSTCVQLAEAMNRLLDSSDVLSAGQKVGVMKRSIRPAYDLASLNLEDVAGAYARLQPSATGPQPGSPGNPAGWMDPSKFVLRRSQGKPWKVALAVDLESEMLQGASVANGTARYTTLSCPARVSPGGVRSPIGRLWEWTVELAEKAGLLAT